MEKGKINHFKLNKTINYIAKKVTIFLVKGITTLGMIWFFGWGLLYAFVFITTPSNVVYKVPLHHVQKMLYWFFSGLILFCMKYFGLKFIRLINVGTRQTSLKEFKTIIK